jgi:hypothetical protein
MGIHLFCSTLCLRVLCNHTLSRAGLANSDKDQPCVVDKLARLGRVHLHNRYVHLKEKILQERTTEIGADAGSWPASAQLELRVPPPEATSRDHPFVASLQPRQELGVR